MSLIPRWLIVLIIVAVVAYVGNVLGLVHIHASVGF
jgi:hypothetical protein